MAQQTVNPYSAIGTQYSNGLDTIATAISGTTPDVNDIIDEVVTAVEGVYYASPTTTISMELNSIGSQGINGYINSEIAKLYPRQSAFIQLMYRILSIQVQSIKSYVEDIEDNITKSSLSIQQQTPLLIATEIGKSAYDYWDGVITAGGASPWGGFINSDAAINTANLPYWVLTSMLGALAVGKNAASYPLLESEAVPAPQVDFISALTGSMAVVTGKVVLDFTPRIQPTQLMSSLSLNRRSVVNLNKNIVNMGGNGGDTLPPAWTGGCTDGCLGSAAFGSWWNCTERDCTTDCQHGGSVCVCNNGGGGNS